MDPFTNPFDSPSIHSMRVPLGSGGVKNVLLGHSEELDVMCFLGGIRKNLKNISWGPFGVCISVQTFFLLLELSLGRFRAKLRKH